MVRFLQEPEDWTGYLEAWDAARNRSFPVQTDQVVGSEVRQSQRYLANALDIQTQTVIPLRLPVSLVNKLIMRYERYNTMLDREYYLMRSGKGIETEYDLEAEPPSQIDVDKYELLDLDEVLDATWQSVFGNEGKQEVKVKPLFDPDKEEDEEDGSAIKDGWYTEAQLKAKSASELRQLCDDYDIPWERSTPKSALIELLIEEGEKF